MADKSVCMSKKDFEALYDAVHRTKLPYNEDDIVSILKGIDDAWAILQRVAKDNGLHK